MKTVNIPLSEEEVEKIARIDETIRRRSLDLGTATLKVRSIEDQLAGVYEARNKTMDDKIKSSGLDYSKVRNVGIAPDPANPQLAIMVIQVEESEETEEKPSEPETPAPSN